MADFLLRFSEVTLSSPFRLPFGEKLALRHGVTSPMELEAGVYPLKEWYARLEGRCRSNYGESVGTLLL